MAGFHCLGDASQHAVASAAGFDAAIMGSALKVTRGILLTRQQGERSMAGLDTLQEAVRLLPVDQIRTCLARVNAAGRRKCNTDIMALRIPLLPCMI